MVEYSKKNLDWLVEKMPKTDVKSYIVVGDATDCRWDHPFDAVACEAFLGQPMSLPPADIKLKQEKERCQAIILGFLKNLSGQVKKDTPVVVAVPAWLRPSGEYSRLNILDEAEKLGYNVEKFTNLGQEDLLYYREGQVVAREIIVLRKK
jgi:tRNA G10  N-methylase Trm11